MKRNSSIQADRFDSSFGSSGIWKFSEAELELWDCGGKWTVDVCCWIAWVLIFEGRCECCVVETE